MKAALPVNENERLKALHNYEILDTLPEQCFDDISHLAAEICGTPIAMVSFIDGERQWFKSRYGFEPTESSRDIAFCAHTILQHDLLVVPNALHDDRFADNPFVTHGPAIRFYAGAPLVTTGGHALGTLCVIDQVERTLTEAQLNSLRALSRQVMAQLELRVLVATEQQRQAQLRAYQEKLETVNQRLAAESVTDDVTGFHNTRYLHQQLDKLVGGAAEQPSPVSLVFFDMDDFKTVVDTHGHMLGAQVLREVAESIAQVIEPHDRIVRYGGDEFVVILPGQPSDDALVKVERMREQIDRTPFLQQEGLNLRVTASFGMASFPEEAGTKIDLLAAADRCLFRSKINGRNQVTRANQIPQPV